jgi:ribose transport system ATP-binding protein
MSSQPDNPAAPVSPKPTAEAGALLSLRGVSKSYAVPVLTGVDLDFRAGQVHALIGANGAGKSTLVRIICGLTRADRGAMTLAGFPHAPSSRRAAADAGVQVVLQELDSIDTLSVAENLFLPRLPHRWGWLDRAALHARATRALALVGLEKLDPRTPAAALGVGRRQLVEIASALARDCRVLVLDEPTAALTASEADRLFAQVRTLRDRGIAVLYISHRLEEIAGLADRVTVLRDGRVVGHGAVGDMPRHVIMALMTGGEPVPPPAGERAFEDAGGRAATNDEPTAATAPVALRVEHLQAGAMVRDVSFEVRRGEILGLSGLVGAGRTETLRAIFGADRRDGGRISLADGRPLRLRSPRDAVRAGIGLVPEDRQADALLLPQSIRSNITLATLPTVSRLRSWIGATLEHRTAVDIATRLDVRGPGLEHAAESLSGGNQQKVVLARWLLRHCAVLLVDEPTRGIDAAATPAIHGVLRALAAGGTALVIVSSDLGELTALCDRIVVLAGGRVTGTFARGAWTDASLMTAAFAAPGGPE